MSDGQDGQVASIWTRAAKERFCMPSAPNFVRIRRRKVRVRDHPQDAMHPSNTYLIIPPQFISLSHLTQSCPIAFPLPLPYKRHLRWRHGPPPDSPTESSFSSPPNTIVPLQPSPSIHLTRDIFGGGVARLQIQPDPPSFKISPMPSSSNSA